MALPIIADVFQISIGYQLAPVSTAANVLHGQAIGLSAQDIADAMAAAWWQAQSWPAILSNECSATELRVTPLDGTSTTAIANSAAFGVVSGQRNSPAGGLGESLVVSEYTDVRGRSGRGRYYLPYLADIYLDAFKASWQDANSDITNAYNHTYAQILENIPGLVLGVVSALHKTFHPTVFRRVNFGYVGMQRLRLPRP
jgi:hypothetical protein